jgi:hypothetical protein
MTMSRSCLTYEAAWQFVAEEHEADLAARQLLNCQGHGAMRLPFVLHGQRDATTHASHDST